MSYDSNNIFAKILRGDIPCDKVYETEDVLAFKDIHPKAPIHVLVIPKGPYMSLNDFTTTASDTEIANLFRAVGEVARLLGLEDSGYRVISNCGENGRQDVPHLHIHIVGGAPLGAMLPS